MRRTVRALARVGLAARAAVYLLVGVLALQVVAGQPGGRVTDSSGAMRELMREPMGYLLLAAIAIGLLCYSLWRVLMAIFDYDDFGHGLRGFFLRLGQLLGAAVHLGLGVYALNLVFLFSRTTRKPSEQRMVRWMFSLPFGDLLVGAIGAGLIIFGGAQILIAWRESFREYIDIPRQSRWILPVCKYGLVARAVVFIMVGWFFVVAAVRHSPREAGGFREAWKALRAQPNGDFLVALVALGLIAYAFFTLIEAAYRRQKR